MVDWKKDISLRPRKRAEAEAEEATPNEAAPRQEPPAATESKPFWRKELKLGGRKRSAAPRVPSSPTTGFPLPPNPAAEALQRALEAVDAYAAAPLPVVEAPYVEVVPEPVAPADAGDYGWLTADLGGAQPQPDVAAESFEVVAPAPAPFEGDAPSLPPSYAAAPVFAQAPPIPAAAAESHAAPPAARPGIHPPVHASELPPLPEEQPKKSLLRRELSFGRKKATADAEPKPRKERTRKEPKPAAEHVPFWKRDLTPRKKQKAAAPGVEPVAQQPPAEAAERVPFWKRDLSFGGKKAKQAERAAAPAPPAGEKKPAAAKAPKQRRRRGEKGTRHKRLVGLKIGASQLAAAEVVNNGSAQLVKLARVPLQPGVVVAGELREPDALAEALKTFFAKNKLPKRNVRLGIATNRIGVRSFDLEPIDDAKQLANAIRFRAQEALPIPIEDAVLDYHVVGEVEGEDGSTLRRVLLVVAYRELIERYVEACRKAGIKLVGIDLEAFALLRALGEPRTDSDAPAEAATVVVSVGYDRSTFAVSDGRVCEFTRVLEWGGFAVDVAVARVLDLAPSEAEPVKRQLSPTGTDVPEGLTPEQAEAARDAMRKQITTFARELVSSLQFYQNQPGSLSIGGITLTGGTAHMPGLGEELERLIGVPVTVGDPLARVRLGRKVRAEEPVGSLAVAIGLGIED